MRSISETKENVGRYKLSDHASLSKQDPLAPRLSEKESGVPDILWTTPEYSERVVGTRLHVHLIAAV